ncbi:MAG TPA: HAMP domain-containing histidine kinase [Crocinitomicaceae bacterium]|nr:HAMP domain-containing histidine kinase [Crocinitomicaceae bacterium]
MNKRTALIFYVISAYIVLQFAWWGYHLIELTQEVSVESEQVAKRVRMIIGEGSVFLLLILIGVWQIKRSIKKDLKLSENQNNFLLSVTHELKTPLASNKLYIQTIQKRELSKEQQNELLSKAVEENTRLEYMIDNILNASRIENNALVLEKEKFDLNRLIENVLKRFELFANSKTTSQDTNNQLFITADKFSIETILNNLLENAIKYSPENTEIILYSKTENNTIIFGVKDQGIGISKKDKLSIFTKFYRVGNEEVRTQKGTGLGLFIVAQLVRMHNAKIACLDNQPKGTNFQITFQND